MEIQDALMFSGLPTKNGTLVAVISTYIILVIANMLLFRGNGGKNDNKDILQPRSKTMDRVSKILWAP